MIPAHYDYWHSSCYGRLGTCSQPPSGAQRRTMTSPSVRRSALFGWLFEAVSSTASMRSRPIVSAVLALTAFGAAATAQNSPDYQQWRGQHRDGAASGFLEPNAWPEILTLRWKVEVGEGYATPLVVGQTVYTFTRREGNEVLSALNASNGAEQWRSSYPAPYSPSQPAAAHGAGPKATPLFHEGKLFTLGISGIVSAFDALTAKVWWQTPPPPEAPFFSAASSALGEQGVVIVH